MSLIPMVKEIPEQFRDMPNIFAILDSFQEQYDEVYEVLGSLVTDRRIENAVGMQLDLLGSIVGLSRSQASAIVSPTKTESISDELYRLLIKYEIYKHTNGGTYYDVINALQVICDINEIGYQEAVDHPATITLTTEDSISLDVAEKISRIPLIKPAGVALDFYFAVDTDIGEGEIHAGGGFVWDEYTVNLVETQYVEPDPIPLLDSDDNQLLTDDDYALAVW